MTPKILLLDLEDSLVQELKSSLTVDLQAESDSRSSDSSHLDQYDVVFYPCDMKGLQDLLECVRTQKPGLPVIVVSRIPECSQWLDALEAGAADYCAPPIEPTQMRWMLQQHVRTAAAAA